MRKRRTEEQTSTEQTQAVTDEELAKGAVRIAEAVKMTGIGRTSLYSMMNDGSLKYCQVRGMRLIPKSELIRIMKESLVG